MDLCIRVYIRQYWSSYEPRRCVIHFSITTREYISFKRLIGSLWLKGGSLLRRRFVTRTLNDRASRASMFPPAFGCPVHKPGAALSPWTPAIWRTRVVTCRVESLASSACGTFTTTLELGVIHF